MLLSDFQHYRDILDSFPRGCIFSAWSLFNWSCVVTFQLFLTLHQDVDAVELLEMTAAHQWRFSTHALCMWLLSLLFPPAHLMQVAPRLHLIQVSYERSPSPPAHPPLPKTVGTRRFLKHARFYYANGHSIMLIPFPKFHCGWTKKISEDMIALEQSITF